jgi:replication factor C subunit 2/4
MKNELWLEKYRPKILDDVVGNDEILNILRQLSRENNFPNFILSGPPGCGKTTSILALCREILGPHFNEATIELNASDERGLNVVREKIKVFAEKMVRLPKGKHKVVILDEADSLTTAAQQALRMIISNYSTTTRFVFSCNNSNKIIEAIQSRCGMLRFSKLKDQDINKFLRNVIKWENEEIQNKRGKQFNNIRQNCV